MFGLAKRFVNTIQTEASSYLRAGEQEESNVNGIGLRVLHVEKDSLAAQYGLESWFDFVTHVNHTPVESFFRQAPQAAANPYSGINPAENYGENTQLDANNVDFSQLIEYLDTEVNSRQNDLVLTTFSAKGEVSRDITVPYSALQAADPAQLDDVSLSTKSSATVQNSAFRKMHVTLQLCPLSASTYVWHILHVQPNSPASLAGISPDEYIVGCEGGKLATGGEDLVGRVVVSAYNRWRQKAELQRRTGILAEKMAPCSVVLYLYNHDYDTVRPVSIYPNSQWGGPGLLGCDIGYGLLHRLPEVVGKYQSGDRVDMAPGEVVFSQKNETPDLPAAYSAPPPLYDYGTSSGNVLSSHAQAPQFSSSQVHLEGTSTRPPPKAARRGKHGSRLSVARASALEDYFREETEKSRAADRPTGVVNDQPVPPPPKVTKETKETKEAPKVAPEAPEAPEDSSKVNSEETKETTPQ